MFAASNERQAAQLLSNFREFKRRESVGLSGFYLNKLTALEEALLAARERLFQLQVGVKIIGSDHDIGSSEMITISDLHLKSTDNQIRSSNRVNVFFILL